MPSSWELTARVDRASRALARLDGEATRIPNRGLVIRPLVTREAVESARLEGTHTIAARVLLQESGGSVGDPFEAQSNLEVINYLRALEDGRAWIADARPVGTQFIRALHATLLAGTRGAARGPGTFRSKQVAIGSEGDSLGTARFVPPPPEHVQPAIDDLVRFMTDPTPYPPLVAAGIVHYQFEAIHPFEDGNGRLGRLMIPLQLAVSGALVEPVLYLSPYFESRRSDYLEKLKRVSTHGEWQPWLEYFLDAVSAQADDARARSERVLALQEDYQQRARKSGRSSVLGIASDIAMARVVVTVRAVQNEARCDYKTARSALVRLEELGIVEPLGRSHPQRWWAREMVELVYEP